MKIILISNTCSQSEYKKLQMVKTNEKINPSQKYFSMLVDGFAKQKFLSIVCITTRAIDPSNCKIRYLHPKKEISENVKYKYTGILNYRLLKNVYNIFSGLLITSREIRKSKKAERVVLLCDPLAYDISLGAILAAKLYRVQTCSIVTDLPSYTIKIRKQLKSLLFKKAKILITQYILKSFNKYCFLTESMNVINRNKRPYIVIEGMTYINNSVEPFSNMVENNVVVYAGGLYEQFGIIKLIEAASLVMVSGFELHLYGEGLCIEAIKKMSLRKQNIKYMGVVDLNKIMVVEKTAKLLINPRPTTESFTNYSFPSKTIEYMSNARPVLTTRLAGIPKSYFKYLYTIEDETVEGIAKAIEFCLSKPKEELDQMGMRAFNYVKNEKNNIIQSLKIMKLLNNKNE